MAASSSEPAGPTLVLTIPAVRWALEELRASKIHPFFLAYLQLRKRAAEEGSSTIMPHWDELADLLRVRGGPASKPYYRPFWHGDLDPAGYWLNRNIAGSYAPSSIRAVPLEVVEIVDGEYSLRPDHARLALENLLYGERVCGAALGTFFYRNYGFSAPPREIPGPLDLLPVLRRDFRFENSGDFEVLFHDEIPGGEKDWDWFEPLTEAEPVWE